MPEGDTITKLARRIDVRFGGERLTAATTRDPRLTARRGDQLTAGSTLTGAASFGKYLFLRFDDGNTLFSHLGMDGEWHVDRIRPREVSDRQVDLTFADGTLIGSALAKVGYIATADEQKITVSLGPDLCAPDPPDADLVTERLKQPPAAMLAAAMLDQHRVAGWGNVFAVEVPFILGLNPARSADQIDALDDLVRVGIALIRWSASGKPRNTTGRNLARAAHFVYGSSSGRCPVCGSSLTSTSGEASASGRMTWWCPSCQADTHRVADLARARRLLALHPALRSL